jgi:hypothetical protein
MPLRRTLRTIDGLMPGHPIFGRLVFLAGTAAGTALVLWLL